MNVPKSLHESTSELGTELRAMWWWTQQHGYCHIAEPRTQICAKPAVRDNRRAKFSHSAFMKANNYITHRQRVGWNAGHAAHQPLRKGGRAQKEKLLTLLQNSSLTCTATSILRLVKAWHKMIGITSTSSKNRDKDPVKHSLGLEANL